MEMAWKVFIAVLLFSSSQLPEANSKSPSEEQQSFEIVKSILEVYFSDESIGSEGQQGRGYPALQNAFGYCCHNLTVESSH